MSNIYHETFRKIEVYPNTESVRRGLYNYVTEYSASIYRQAYQHDFEIHVINCSVAEGDITMPVSNS